MDVKLKSAPTYPEEVGSAGNQSMMKERLVVDREVETVLAIEASLWRCCLCSWNDILYVQRSKEREEAEETDLSGYMYAFVV